MKTKLLAASVVISALAIVATAQGQASATAGAGSAVQVVYEHPESYTDLKSPNYSETQLLDSLRAYIVQTAAPRLAAGQTLTVTFTDIDLAGAVDTATANRRMKSVFPPKVKFNWVLTNGNGAIVRQDTEDISDNGYLTRSNLARDPMFYEKEMLRVWIRRTFR